MLIRLFKREPTLLELCDILKVDSFTISVGMNTKDEKAYHLLVRRNNRTVDTFITRDLYLNSPPGIIEANLVHLAHQLDI